MPRRKLTEKEKTDRRERMQKKARAEQEASRLSGELDRLREDRARKTEFGEPTRQFKVGDKVRFGSHQNAVIEEVTEDGFYLVHLWGKKQVYTTKDVPYEARHWEDWQSILPYSSHSTDMDIFSYRDDVQISYMQQDLRSLLHYHYRGLDYDPSYQRGHEWDLEDRVLLIESIFKNVDIGKFTFIERGYLPEGPMMEVLDGKQRVTTLVMFYEDRFQWRGRYYSELHPRDRGHFQHFSISVAMTENMAEEQKYRYFLRLNVAGKPQDPEHLAKVERMWQASLEKSRVDIEDETG